MKKLVTVTVFLTVLFLSATLTSRAAETERDAEDRYALEEQYSVEDQYIITQSGESYSLTLSSSGEPSYVASGSITELLSLSGGGAVVFYGVVTDERIELPRGDFTVSGTLSASGVITVCEGTSLTLRDMTLAFSGNSYLRIKGGSVTVSASSIVSEGAAVILDYSSESALALRSGEIKGFASSPAVEILSGKCEIFGGKVENTAGAAISCESSLALGGAPEISGVGYDVITARPISLSWNNTPYTGDGPLRVQYLSSFTKGTMTELFYGVESASRESISLFDTWGREWELTYFDKYGEGGEENFLAVYLPHTVRLYSGGELISSQQRLTGETVNLPTPDSRTGYAFSGWYRDGTGACPYPLGETVVGDVDIYAVYSLLPPEFSISSYIGVYNGRTHTVGFEQLTHPLDGAGGSYELTWYRDGIKYSSGTALTLTDVAESGIYSCEITYRYSKDSVTVTADKISVTVEKAVVIPPDIPALVYCASPLTPSVYSTSLYTVSAPTATDAGSYPVVFALTDPANYRFSDTNSDKTARSFVIMPSDNLWTEKLSVYDIYFGAELDIFAASRFGNVRYEFSVSGAEWSRERPEEVGEYLARAVVDGTANYRELVSEAVSFSVLADGVASLSVITMPGKTAYTAYGLFNPDGMALLAVFHSGRTETVSSSSVTVAYQQGDSLRYGDNAVTLTYGGVSCSVPVTVSKAPYDISPIVFRDTELVYNGSYQTVILPEYSITGVDGLPLLLTVSGGGTDVGEYTVTVSFHTDSLNCEPPAPITAKLTIIPHTAEIIWQNMSFVYDGTSKLPTPTYVDIHGVLRVANATGARVNAGGAYIASAHLDDPNYILTNIKTEFSIQRADYDLSSVVWSNDTFTYSGEERTVTLSGLPEGITLVGYTDNRATAAGSYTARASLLYDEVNYNPPVIPEHSWTVLPAAYDMSGISFESVTAVYDGNIHYPLLSGELPTGADGIALTCSLSLGATHVSEGAVTVTLTFFTDSPNYLTPDPMYAQVTVTPLGIYASWSSDRLVYSGNTLCPVATAEECPLTVSGGATGAGSYTAVATAQNTDYYVINDEYPFVIEKAKNGWRTSLSVENIYTSGTLSPIARPVFGEPTFTYFSDPQCTEAIAPPTEAGVYYVLAAVSESENYLALTSSPVRFEILAVLPVALDVRLVDVALTAFYTLREGDLVAFVSYNDGSVTDLSLADLTLVYERGDSLRRGDSAVTVKYGELSYSLPVTVGYADYDMTGAVWENTSVYYDGAAKHPTLVGLPEGIEVTGYTETPVNAGSYTVSAIFTYDAENYNEPTFPECSFTVRKSVVNVPVVPTAEYNGAPHTPVTYSPLYYFADVTPKTGVGEYSLTAKLRDPDNYEFESGGGECSVSYRILPRVISIDVLDYELFLFESVGAADYVILEGEVVQGDSLALVQYTEGDGIYLRSANPNYELRVSAGKICRLGYPSPELTAKLIIGFIFLIAIGLLILIIYVERERILDTIAIARYKMKSKRQAREEARPTRAADSFGEVKKTAPRPTPTANTVDESHDISHSSPDTDTDSPLSNLDRDSSADEDIYDGTELLPELTETEEDDTELLLKLTETDEGDTELLRELTETEEGDTGVLHVATDADELILTDGIDVAHAEELITDALAKDLLKRSREAVYTDGDGRGIINVDTLSSAFAPGDRVDVNILKRKSLIPYDTAYLKVLARGVIDKPLSVYANDFSLAAVKMIALTGGEAVRVVTLKKKDGN